MEKLLENQNLIINDFETLPYYPRQHYQTIRLGNRINGIVGPRGTGKTTFLLKTAIANGAKQGQALYVSADNIFFLEHKLLELAEWAYKETDISFLCIDEIHKYSNWNQELKNIYDTFASLKVLFSGSSMIDIVHSKYDLSRRVTLYPMFGFSFREYLDYYHNISLGIFSLEELVNNHIEISQSFDSSKILKIFKEYLKLGYYPFTKLLDNETDQYQGIENVIQKTIYEDIATLHNLKTASLLVIEKLFKYVVCSSPGELNTNKLASRLQKDFNDVSKYLAYLNDAGLINLLYLKKLGKALLGAPDKMLPDNPNMIYAYFKRQGQDDFTGKARETFFVNQLTNSGHEVYYSKVGDYQVDSLHFEIGGKNKTTKQIKQLTNAYVLADNLVVGGKTVIPLYLMGLLY